MRPSPRLPPACAPAPQEPPAALRRLRDEDGARPDIGPDTRRVARPRAESRPCAAPTR